MVESEDATLRLQFAHSLREVVGSVVLEPRLGGIRETDRTRIAERVRRRPRRAPGRTDHLLLGSLNKCQRLLTNTQAQAPKIVTANGSSDSSCCTLRRFRVASILPFADLTHLVRPERMVSTEGAKDTQDHHVMHVVSGYLLESPVQRAARV